MTPYLRTARDWTVAQGVRGLLWLGGRLPYRARVRILGLIGGRVFAPLSDFPTRIRANLALVCPELDRAAQRRIVRNVPVNAVRTLVEIHSGPEFTAAAAAAQVRGAEHLAAVEAAHAAGRPVILVSGHFGNYDVPRAALAARGIPVGGLYRPLKNRFYNTLYVDKIARISGPVFPRGRRGLAEMVRFLRDGGVVGLLIDQRMGNGVPLSFFGRPAWTALSAAEMALKYDALILPAYGRRINDGMDFELVLEPPIPHGDPAGMTQALNDSLERMVRADMEQWLWFHRRWRDPHGGPDPRV
ncbi:MAG: lysophospholipid acyltransferase family protein [Alkalilacustris sp.]